LANYLITGGAGFIGSHLAHALVERGDQVRVLDNFETGLRKNLDPVLDRIDLRQVDLTDAEAVRSACEGIDYVLHQGALPSVPRSVKEPRPSHATNIDGTFNVLEGSRLAGVKRVVYAASSSAYGNQPGFPRVETMAPQPLSPYAVQKLTGELYMQAYWRVYGLETVCLRYFNIFGARQVPDSPYSGVMARFILMMMRGERPAIFGNGEQGRDFTHVENVVSANLLAVERNLCTSSNLSGLHASTYIRSRAGGRCARFTGGYLSCLRRFGLCAADRLRRRPAPHRRMVSR